MTHIMSFDSLNNFNICLGKIFYYPHFINEETEAQ